MARDYDAIIVGAGMVGALSAVLLARQGMSVALIDRHDGRYALSVPPAYDARVSAISRHSQQLLSEAGAWQRIDSTRLAAYQKMRVWDGLGQGEVDFDCAQTALPDLGHLVENNVLCQGLMDAVQDTRGVDLFLSDMVTEQQRVNGRVEVTLASDRQLSGQVLIAADGARSQMRDQFGFNMVEWDYGHHAIVTTVQVDRSHQDTAWQAFGDEGILAFLPLPSVNDEHFISIVWSVPPMEAEALMALSDEAFCQRLTYAISERFNAMCLTVPRQAIPLRQRHAKQYIQENVVLIGDAAHTIHPLAGQGANLGFGDVGDLVAILTKAFKRGEDLGSMMVLRRYQRARIIENVLMSASMETFKRVFTTTQPAIVQLRNTAMKLAQSSAFIRNKLVAHASGIK
ncbi:2-octaprenyl-3-methyl-6-methoxy-1,4-benzoquinol hydroxylase [Maribrevibacterium harenarium]|uniref:2-octaprenyl-3-methyl-6-methoxy-1,4-benzoquinol hydroxylase n=1 Tax=Maribrevibacterium harenarium TaxID=2589817 RepID=A0A501WU54_9GAMM|nr:UbiH/UbiF/VisC/COQ6 family ubiquinone biosynthesis hydroxylase [Maribrevibacterium harenarium]TPE50907.1 2-octaprenyl-3-methyl-6-methoxy-1,4-benzoquinol hydroxylase [Maribrevibacterium harenarium]